MQNNNEFLGTEKIGRLLFKLAVPAVTAQIVNMLYNIVDRIYIGHMQNGKLALTGVGVCLPLIMLISAFSALIGMGGAPLASIYMGKNEKNTAEKILGNCFSTLILISAALTIFMFVENRKLLLMFGASENTIEYASPYMTVYSIGTLAVQLSLGMNMFITAQGFATVSMLSVLIGAVSNILLDPLFIFGLNWGVKGAAVATIISQTVSAAWVVSFLLSKKSVLRIKKSNLIPNSKTMLPCIALGLSPFIMQSTESVISVCFNSSLLKYGGDIAVGAMTILSSVMQFAMLPLSGLTQGAQPIISYNFGAKNVHRVKEAFFILLKCCLIYSILLWGAVIIFPQAFAGMFSSDAELIEYTKTALRIYMAASLLFGIQIACQQTFIAIGNAKTSLFLAILRKVVLLIPFIYIFPQVFDNKAIGVYFAEPAADFIAVSVTSIMFIIQFKAALKKI